LVSDLDEIWYTDAESHDDYTSGDVYKFTYLLICFVTYCREATPAVEKARRSELAVAAALTKHAETGQVTIGQLTEICRHQRRHKPPWIEDEEDRRFTGYQSVTEALEAMNVDVKKVYIAGCYINAHNCDQS